MAGYSLFKNFDKSSTGHSALGAKEEMLARLRAALGREDEATAPAPSAIPRSYHRADGPLESEAEASRVREVLIDRLLDYKARVHHTDVAGLSGKIGELLADASSVVVPAAVPREWLEYAHENGPTHVVIDEENSDLGPRELDSISAVVTGCRIAVASTGTIVLDGHTTNGRRAISLVPDHHVCVVFPDQIVLGVPAGFADLARTPERPFTLISGPSATSDIELSRVEGVHGPRNLDVILIDG